MPCASKSSKKGCEPGGALVVSSRSSMAAGAVQSGLPCRPAGSRASQGLLGLLGGSNLTVSSETDDTQPMFSETTLFFLQIFSKHRGHVSAEKIAHPPFVVSAFQLGGCWSDVQSWFLLGGQKVGYKGECKEGPPDTPAQPHRTLLALAHDQRG